MRHPWVKGDWVQNDVSLTFFMEKIDLWATPKLRAILKINSVKYIVKNILVSLC